MDSRRLIWTAVADRKVDDLAKFSPDEIAAVFNDFKYITFSSIILFRELCSKYPDLWHAVEQKIKNKRILNKVIKVMVVPPIDCTYNLTGGRPSHFKAKIDGNDVMKMKADGSWIKVGELK